MRESSADGLHPELPTASGLVRHVREAESGARAGGSTRQDVEKRLLSRFWPPRLRCGGACASRIGPFCGAVGIIPSVCRRHHPSPRTSFPLDLRRRLSLLRTLIPVLCHLTHRTDRLPRQPLERLRLLVQPGPSLSSFRLLSPPDTLPARPIANERRPVHYQRPRQDGQQQDLDHALLGHSSPSRRFRMTLHHCVTPVNYPHRDGTLLTVGAWISVGITRGRMSCSRIGHSLFV